MSRRCRHFRTAEMFEQDILKWDYKVLASSGKQQTRCGLLPLYCLQQQQAGGTTDVHVLHNDTSLFNADIDGYGGDPAYHKVQGLRPSAQYSGQVAMKADETITFAVGYGKNKTHFGDTTGLFARVVLLGDSHTPAR